MAGTSLGVGLNVEGIDKIISKANKNKLFAQPLKKFFTNSAIDVQRTAKQNAVVDTGRLRSDIGYEIDGAAIPLYAAVGNTVFYAPFVEKGTRPHFPPPQALDVWARRHGFVSGFVVARHIAMFGTQAHPYLVPGLEDNVGNINRHLVTAAGEMEGIWGG